MKSAVEKDLDDEVEMMEVEYPETEDPATIERRETARVKQEKWQKTRLVKDLVLELVEGVETESVARSMIDKILDRSWWRVTVNSVWGPLEFNPELQRIIQKKMERQKKLLSDLVDEVNREKEEDLELYWAEDVKMVWGGVDVVDRLADGLATWRLFEEDKDFMDDRLELEMTMDWSQVEDREHGYLEDWMKSLGISGDMRECMELEEVEAHKELDDIMDRLLESKMMCQEYMDCGGDTGCTPR
jgi:hypothetical protein